MTGAKNYSESLFILATLIFKPVLSGKDNQNIKIEQLMWMVLNAACYVRRFNVILVK